MKGTWGVSPTVIVFNLYSHFPLSNSRHPKSFEIPFIMDVGSGASSTDVDAIRYVNVQSTSTNFRTYSISNSRRNELDAMDNDCGK